jgi:CRISPR/Cas system-associated exonuclease Cas4 (RecB family)
MTVFYKFTTGPVENVIEGGPIGISNQVYVKALNNYKTNNAKVRIKVYSLKKVMQGLSLRSNTDRGAAVFLNSLNSLCTNRQKLL